MSDCQSFSTSCRPRSQSQKISIGILVDSEHKTKPGVAKQDGETDPGPEKAISSGRSDTVATPKAHGITTVRTKQTEDPEPEGSPWISTRPFNEGMTAMKPCAENASTLPVSRRRSKRFSSVKKAPPTPSVQFFVNLDSNLQSGYSKGKKFNRFAKTRNEGKYGEEKGVGESSFAAVQEASCPGRGVTTDERNKAENTSRETLKIKLQEILGNASPKGQFSNSQENVMENADNMMPEPRIEQAHNEVITPRQNTDTIETDSEVDQTITRPATRSLARKRRQPDVKTIKNKKGVPLGCREEERDSEPRCPANSGGSLLFVAKKSERKRIRIEPRKLLFSRNDGSYGTPPEVARFKAPSPARKTPSLHNRKIIQKIAPQADFEGKNSPGSHVTEKAKLGDLSRPSPSGTVPQKGMGNPDMAFLHDDFQSPTFGFRAPPEISSPDSPPNPNHKNQDGSIPVPEHDDFQSPTFGFREPSEISSPSSPPQSNHGSQDGSIPAPAEKSFMVGDGGLGVSRTDNTANLTGDSSGRKSVPTAEEQDVGHERPASLSDESDSESSEECSYSNEEYTVCWGTEALLPEIGTAENLKFTPSATKRMRGHAVTSSIVSSPASTTSFKGAEETEGFHPDLEQEEDGLARVIAHFASTLERVKSKMKFVAGMKSSEIMTSTTEAIQMQLQKVGSQIQTDVVKLTGYSKSKRKHMEGRLLEKQDKLKLIHQKFKEEVNQHLLDCSSTLEGLETHRIEFKGAIEKQKASHKKLLLQVEEAIETQLKDTQRRMTIIQKVMREKMLQLKLVVAECLKEDLFW